MRRLWWLAVPVLLAVVFHRFSVSLDDDHVRYVVGTTQAACSIGVLDRERCARARSALRASFEEVGAEAFVAAETRPFVVYSRMWNGLDSYSPLLSLALAPLNALAPRLGGLVAYQVLGWLALSALWLLVYLVALGLLAAALGGRWLDALVVLNASLLLVGALDVFGNTSLLANAVPRTMVVILIVAGVLRRGALEARTGRSAGGDAGAWACLLAAALLHVKMFELLAPPLLAVMVLRLGRGAGLARRVLVPAGGLALCVAVAEALRHWMNAELYGLGLARDWRGLPADAPAWGLDSLLRGVRLNVAMLREKEFPLFVALFAIAALVVCAARRRAPAPWTTLETAMLAAVAAWVGVASLYDAGLWFAEPFRRAFLGLGLFAVLATALADPRLLPWAGGDGAADAAAGRIEGALQALCVAVVAWWAISFGYAVKHWSDHRPTTLAAHFLTAPVEGRLLRYVGVALGTR